MYNICIEKLFGGKVMEKDLEKKIMKKAKEVSIKIAEHYINVACPFIMYQPKINDNLKKRRNSI